MRRRRRIPPSRMCAFCGHVWRGWSLSCPKCAPDAGTGDPVTGETLREYRQRVIDPERNA